MRWLLLIALFTGCATAPPARKTGALIDRSAIVGRPADQAEGALRDALTRLEGRRPYLVGDVFHSLEPIPLVIFLDEGQGGRAFSGEVPPFAGGPQPQVEYLLKVTSMPAPGDDSLFIRIEMMAKYDAMEGDADRYDTALRALRDAVSVALWSELQRAGEPRGVEWKPGNL